jgi:hypothetical protein
MPDDYCEACGKEVAIRECAHGILCGACDRDVHGDNFAHCDVND